MPPTRCSWYLTGTTPSHKELTVTGHINKGTGVSRRLGAVGGIGGMGVDLGEPLPALLPTCTVATTQL